MTQQLQGNKWKKYGHGMPRPYKPRKQTIRHALNLSIFAISESKIKLVCFAEHCKNLA